MGHNFFLLSLVGTAAASTLPRQSAPVSVVNLSNRTGTPQRLASGLLYGIPNTAGQIPDSFYTDFGITYARGGGTHLPNQEGAMGWNAGLEYYQTRFASALTEYNTVRKFGANFSILTADLWGADDGASSSKPFPGDGGNWTSYDNFLSQVISDLEENNATAGMTFDMWNEPDLSYAWKPSQAQFLQMWGRGYPRIRKAFPGMSIVGPSTAGSPGTDNAWWDKYCAFVKQNASWPDQWSWHMEPGKGDLMSTQAGLIALQQKYGLPRGRLNINEYATKSQMTPVYDAWYIAQLERINAYGLRGIWLSAAKVFDLFGGILSKPNVNGQYSPTSGGYSPTGEFQVYKYYTRNMTGQRIGTLPSADHTTDIYATLDSTNRLKLLYGSRAVSSSSSITINNLSSIGLPKAGKLALTIYGFPFPGGQNGVVNAPVYVGTGNPAYSGDTATFVVRPADNMTAYAFEIQGVAT